VKFITVVKTAGHRPLILCHIHQVHNFYIFFFIIIIVIIITVVVVIITYLSWSWATC
jgi:hypothetical protein